MKTEAQQSALSGIGWLSIVALLISLYFMYSSTFLSDYLMNDEWAQTGVETPNAVDAIKSNYFAYGRGLFGLYQKIVYDYAGIDTGHIQFIRFISFASFAIIAAVLAGFLESTGRSAYFAFFTVLFFLSQAPFQGLMGYSLQLISNTLPAIWLSLLSFYLFFFVLERTRLPMWVQAAIVFVILMLAMQSTQAYAFFATIPVAYLTLFDWRNRKPRILHFLIIMLGVLIVSAFLYQAGLKSLHAQGEHGYGLGEAGFQSLSQDPPAVFSTALNPVAYWSAFQLWTFPFPFHNIHPLGLPRKELAAILVMLLWLALILGAVLVEIKEAPPQDKREVIFKWLVLAFLFGIAAIFIVADSPTEIIDHRPHVLLTFVGLVIFTAAYALRVISTRIRFLQSDFAKVLAGAIVLYIALGAQAGVLRNVVYNHVEQLSFMRSQMLAKDPSSYDKVIVVLPEWYGCVREPCGPWFGEVTEDLGHLSHVAAYHYALATIGGDEPFKKFTFRQKIPSQVPHNAVVIDWNKYVDAQRR